MTNQCYVLHHVAGHGQEATRSEERTSGEGHALAVGELPIGTNGPGIARWAEAVNECGEQCRMQPRRTCCGAFESPAHTHEFEAVGHCSGDHGARKVRRRTRVGIERYHPVAGGCLHTLLQCPRLARPVRWKRCAGHHTCPGGGRHGSRGVGALVVDDNHLDRCRQHSSRRGASPEERVEQWADALRLIARRHHHRDGGNGRRRAGRRSAGRRSAGRRSAGRLEGRTPPARPGETNQCGDGRCHSGNQDDAAEHHTRWIHRISAAMSSATMRALVVTKGRPPPGWLLPPTR